MEQFEESLQKEDDVNSTNADNFIYGSGNSGYFVSEIPTRASNPLIYDARFIESDLPESNESEQLHSYLMTVGNDTSSRLEAY